jgi:hypothetical protein
MTQDEIIDMAREAGIIHPEMVAKHLAAFAKLVAAKAVANLEIPLYTKHIPATHQGTAPRHQAIGRYGQGQDHR